MRGTTTAILMLIAAACAGGESQGGRQQVVVASTTSVEDSGLLDALVPAFEAAHPAYEVAVVAVGSGEALALGRRRDADVLLVHSPAAESAFVAAGHGTDRREVMRSDFVIVGPASDPAGVRGFGDAAEALRRIAAAGAPFISRGDDSGTHARERALWAAAGVAPSGRWYRDAGQGMGEVLRIASEAGAYALTDRATHLFLSDMLRLDVLVEGDDRLLNIYSVIPVAGAANAAGARALRDWITGPAGQALIAGYGAGRFGRPLFVHAGAR